MMTSNFGTEYWGVKTSNGQNLLLWFKFAASISTYGIYLVGTNRIKYMYLQISILQLGFQRYMNKNSHVGGLW